MPVMGPSQDFSFSVGDEIYEKVVSLLAEKNVRPVQISTERDKIKQEENFAQLKELLREIVWHDHATGW